MREHLRPSNCTEKCEKTTSREESIPRRYFGDNPDDLEMRTNEFLDRGCRISSSKTPI